MALNASAPAAATSAGPSVTDWITAVCAAVTVLVAVFAALYARRQWLESKTTRVAAEKGEVERLQPQVSMFIDVSPETPEHADLVIRNFGPTAAHDVRVTFTVPLERALVDNPMFKKIVVPDIPFLAPGQEWRTWWDQGEARLRSDLPQRYDGQIEYRGLGGTPVIEHGVVLDFKPYAMVARNSGRGTLSTITKALKDLTKAVQQS